MNTKPWEGIIPPEDVAAFGRSYDSQFRPLTAGTRPCLIVVDMTLAFVDSAYSTGWSPTGWPAVDANAELLAAARAAELPIFFTKSFPDVPHVNLPIENGRWKTTTRVAPPEGTPPGDVIVDALAPLPGEVVIHKLRKPSGFSGTQLASYLIYNGCDTAIITGMTTSGCVRATTLDAFQLNFHCILPYECIADRSQISHKVNLFDLHMKYADVVSLAETIDYIEKLPD